MNICKNIKVPTGNILVVEGDIPDIEWENPSYFEEA
jgi:hypothetical protein